MAGCYLCGNKPSGSINAENCLTSEGSLGFVSKCNSFLIIRALKTLVSRLSCFALRRSIVCGIGDDKDIRISLSSPIPQTMERLRAKHDRRLTNVFSARIMRNELHLLTKPREPSLVKQFSAFMEPEGLLPHK